MSSNNNMTLSKTIMFLRFPLIVAVVFIHTILISSDESGQYPTYRLIRYVISEEFARIAVPLFFFFSGFLFFYNSDFSIGTYFSKLKKRARTLLVPYIFWNIVVLLLFLLTQIFLASLTSGKNKLIADYNWLDYLNIFWNNKDGYPICYQFWFIRDLMVVVLLSPLVYYFVKYCKIFGIVLLGTLWIFDFWFDIVGLSISSFFFFSFGAWFSINNHDFTIDFRPMRQATTFIYLALVVLSTYLWQHKISEGNYVHNIRIIFGLIAAISWTAYGFTNNRLHTSNLLAGSSFFVYAYHGMALTLIVKCYNRLIPTTNEFMILVGYFLLPTIIVVLGVGIYALMRKYLPTFTSIITGGR